MIAVDHQAGEGYCLHAEDIAYGHLLYPLMGSASPFAMIQTQSGGCSILEYPFAIHWDPMLGYHSAVSVRGGHPDSLAGCTRACTVENLCRLRIRVFLIHQRIHPRICCILCRKTPPWDPLHHRNWHCKPISVTPSFSGFSITSRHPYPADSLSAD